MSPDRYEPERSDSGGLWVVFALLLLSILFGWHLFNFQQTKDRLDDFAHQHVPEVLQGWSVVINGNPVTNTLEIQLLDESRSGNRRAEAWADTILTYFASQLEPEVERQLARASRSNLDLYAMALPYQATIRIGHRSL